MTARKPPILQAIEEDRKHWHFERRLSVDTLVGIIGVAVVLGGPFLVWAKAMDNRVLVLEVAKEDAAKQETKRDVDIREQRSLVGGRLDKIDDRIGVIQIDIAKLVTSVNAGQIAAAAAVGRAEAVAPIMRPRNGH